VALLVAEADIEAVVFEAVVFVPLLHAATTSPATTTAASAGRNVIEGLLLPGSS
jgi:hypothetical protein